MARRNWAVRNLPGEFIYTYGDLSGPGQMRTAYAYFFSMFPIKQLVRMVRLTSPVLDGRGLRPTTWREMLKHVGVIDLATGYEFGSRVDVCST